MVDLAILVAHWWMMIVPLHGWAEGSLLLVFMTFSTSWTTMESIGLMTGEPSWMMAPKSLRMLGYIGALVSVCSFVG